MTTLATLPTPCLIVEEARMMANIERLAAHARRLGVALRPHLKTVKSVEIARRVLANATGPATVSTLAEAEVFATAGITDILYAVGITPQKLQRVQALRARGCDLTVLLDSIEQTQAVTEVARATVTAAASAPPIRH